MYFAVLSSRAEGLAQFLTAILIFLLVLALTYFTTRFVGNFQKNQFAYRNFEAIESFRITNGKYLQLVRIGGKYIVLGIGKDSVSMICEIPEEDIKTSSEGVMSKDAFAELFNKAKAKVGKRDDSHEE